MRTKSRPSLRDVPGLILLLAGAALVSLAQSVGGERTREAVMELMNMPE